ncbi:MAG: hypothetical protein HPY50_08990 [Firmicutes bacterium]|nr:hypothetical protein [Bacillota bacterium]
MTMESMKVTSQEKRLIELMRENGVEPLQVYKALSEYGRGIAEDTYFEMLADPENYKANEKRFEVMEKALKGYISGDVPK